jgi:hypothetical protein
MPCTLDETTCKSRVLIRSCVCQAAMMLLAMLLMPCCIQCLCHPLPNAGLLHAAADSHLLVISQHRKQSSEEPLPPSLTHAIASHVAHGGCGACAMEDSTAEVTLHSLSPHVSDNGTHPTKMKCTHRRNTHHWCGTSYIRGVAHDTCCA